MLYQRPCAITPGPTVTFWRPKPRGMPGSGRPRRASCSAEWREKSAKCSQRRSRNLRGGVRCGERGFPAADSAGGRFRLDEIMAILTGLKRMVRPGGIRTSLPVLGLRPIRAGGLT